MRSRSRTRLPPQGPSAVFHFFLSVKRASGRRPSRRCGDRARGARASASLLILYRPGALRSATPSHAEAGRQPRRVRSRGSLLRARSRYADSALEPPGSTNRAARLSGRSAERGTYPSTRTTWTRFLGLSLSAGVDAARRLLRLVGAGARATNYYFVVDTAPTVHTLRLLSHARDAPQALDGLRDMAGEALRPRRGAGLWPLLPAPTARRAHSGLSVDEGRALAYLLRDSLPGELSWCFLPRSLSVAEAH